jgi:siroheme synthase
VTTIVYMPVKTLPALVAKARDAGLDPATPAVAVAQATRADERTIAGSIAELPALLAAEAPSGPVVVMIGRVFAGYARMRCLGPSPNARRDSAGSRTSSGRGIERRLFQPIAPP